MTMRMRFGHRTQARVLVADWDRNNALTVAAAMHRAGFHVATAFNGKEAVAKAATFRPDLLITEAYLGRLSGIPGRIANYDRVSGMQGVVSFRRSDHKRTS